MRGRREKMGMFRVLRRGATVVALGAAAGAVVITARHLLETPQPLESLLPGEERIDRDHGGDIYYNVAGPHGAPPLVLLHDFYPGASRSEEHTSELQSHVNLVCRLLLE